MYNLVLFISLFLFLGCSVKQPLKEEVTLEVQSLKIMVMNLSPSIQEKEADDLAKGSINYSYQLAKEYDAITLPWWQNSLVNMGLKKRGLCHQWTEDLLKFLVKKNYKTLEFHAIGANIGYFNEHNSLSVSAKGESVKKSIILDAWRNSGKLYFSKINEDNDYEWKERFNLYGILPPKR